MPLSADITFEPQPDGQSSPSCTDIMILDDGVLERSEMLFVEVQTSSLSRVLPDPSADTATIEIVDNDRKCHMT